jgi:hypothetical protein
VAEQARFDVLGAEGFAQERVVHEINLADGKVVGGSPVSVDFPEFFRRQWSSGLRWHGFTLSEADFGTRL